MDGADRMDDGLERLAAYVRRYAPRAGYDLNARGGQARLARDAKMTPAALSRILNAERMPKAAVLWPLSQALHRDYTEMLVEAGIIPAESVAHGSRGPAASQPITAEALADEWGVTNAKSRELVRDMIERVRLIAQQSPDDHPDHGDAARD